MLKLLSDMDMNGNAETYSDSDARDTALALFASQRHAKNIMTNIFLLLQVHDQCIFNLWFVLESNRVEYKKSCLFLLNPVEQFVDGVNSYCLRD